MDKSRSARGDGTGHMDPVDKLNWLDEENKEEVV